MGIVVLSKVVRIHQHVLLSLERLMHVENLTVWSNSSSALRPYLFLV